MNLDKSAEQARIAAGLAEFREAAIAAGEPFLAYRRRSSRGGWRHCLSR